MALLGNYQLFHKMPLRYRGGLVYGGLRSNYSMSGSNRNQYAGGYSNFGSTPNGYLHPYSWIMAPYTGGMATYTSLRASIYAAQLDFVSGINLTSSMSAGITLSNAQLDQIVSLIASITGSMGITNAQLAAVAGISSSMSASMSITNAELGAIVSLVISMSGSISTQFNAFATANMVADIGGATALSPEGLAEAVWNYLKANPTVTGSMKEVLEKAKLSADNAFAVSS